MLFQARRCPPPAVKVPHLSGGQRARVIPAGDSLSSDKAKRMDRQENMKLYIDREELNERIRLNFRHLKND